MFLYKPRFSSLFEPWTALGWELHPSQCPFVGTCTLQIKKLPSTSWKSFLDSFFPLQEMDSSLILCSNGNYSLNRGLPPIELCNPLSLLALLQYIHFANEKFAEHILNMIFRQFFPLQEMDSGLVLCTDAYHSPNRGLPSIEHCDPLSLLAGVPVWQGNLSGYTRCIKAILVRSCHYICMNQAAFF